MPRTFGLWIWRWVLKPVKNATIPSLKGCFQQCVTRTYFDTMVTLLLPLLVKLTTGKTAALLSLDYEDLDDPSPRLDWQQVIHQRGIVYVGLHALSDSKAGAAVGNSMFADLESIAGHIYKLGINDGLPENGDGKLPISMHFDELNELMGDEFFPLINRSGGAGIEVTAYTQTISYIEARIASSAKAAQVTGNFNTLIMLRVRENRTAKLLTSQLPEVDVYSKILVSDYTDITNQEQGTDFTFNTQDRVSIVKMSMLTPADIINLPKTWRSLNWKVVSCERYACRYPLLLKPI